MQRPLVAENTEVKLRAFYLRFPAKTQDNGTALNGKELDFCQLPQAQ